MKKTKKVFSLIEVIVAAGILSIAVFWVYKLIWENTKLINNSDNFLQLNSLFPSLEECINYIWFDSFKASSQTNYIFNFWATWTWCFTWNSNQFILDNNSYELLWNITWSWNNYIDWELNISSDWVWNNSKTFKQIK